MALRNRVTIMVLVMVVLPLLVGAVWLAQAAAPPAIEQQETVARDVADARQRLDLIEARASDQAQLLAARNAVARVTAGDPSAAREWLTEQMRGDAPAGRADVVALVDADRRPLAVYRVTAPRGMTAPSDGAIARSAGGMQADAVLTVARPLRPGGTVAGWVVVGVWLDDELAAALPARRAALVDHDAVVGASAPVPDDLVLPAEDDGRRASTHGRWTVAVAGVSPGRQLVVWAPAPVALPGWAWLALPGWALLALVALWVLLGRMLSVPLLRAAAVARGSAGGAAGLRMTRPRSSELRGLAEALDQVGSELDRRQEELAESREQLRGALSRLGETLSSSLDLERTLAVVTDTAMDTVQADRATLVLTTGDDDLEVRIVRGFALSEGDRFDPDSLPGWIVRTGMSVRLPADHVVIAAAVDGGVLATHQLSVPVTGTVNGGCVGALLLARPDRGPAFREDDLRTVRAFATQAGVAIENVLLHQEARRLSLTDPLTELWNFRYFQLQAIREVEAATRYHRPLGLLIVDLDHFKRVNDLHGHPVGDQVLTEIGRRIRTATRLPDVVARYGGEEFVLLLPGTDAAGAMVTAERIRQRIARLPIVAGGSDALRVTVTCSIGVAAYPTHGMTIDELLRRADAALYAAKSQGRDRVVDAGGTATDTAAATPTTAHPVATS